MTANPALLAAVATNPGDDLPRLVYADWLDENDQPERADFIRVQIALIRSPLNSEARPLLAKREGEHLKAWQDLLEPDDRELFDRSSFRPVFSRGFVSELVFPDSHWERRPTHSDRVNRVASDWHHLCDLFAKSPLVWKVEYPYWFYLVIVPVAAGGWKATRVLHPAPRCNKCNGRGRTYRLLPESCDECDGKGHYQPNRDFVTTAFSRIHVADQLIRNAIARDLFGDIDLPPRP